MSTGAQPRVVAARVVTGVTTAGRSLSELLPPALDTLDHVRDRALVQALVYGTLRFQPRLQLLLGQLLDKPIRKKDAELNGLLLVGLQQISAMAVPDHAAVAATVDAAAGIGHRRAKGLVNAVLRRYLRERETMEVAADASAEGRYSHPGWIIRQLRQEWPQHWEQILDQNNLHPPMWLRVNAAAGTRDEWMVRAGAPPSEPSPWAPQALRLQHPVDVAELPGFGEGLVSVQDAAAQLAAHLVSPLPGQRCLDACAAPGGKSGHLLELCPTLDLTAVDVDPERLARVGDNLDRLGLSATLIAADAAMPDQWWDGHHFDAILLDAPCTASGVIRRHPDIKLLRREADIGRLSGLQSRLLDQLWPTLKVGGRLVYCTCSVFRQEGPAQVGGFLARTPDARLDDEQTAAGWGIDAAPGRQILPGETGMDGFYYACLSRSG